MGEAALLPDRHLRVDPRPGRRRRDPVARHEALLLHARRAVHDHEAIEPQVDSRLDQQGGVAHQHVASFGFEARGTPHFLLADAGVDQGVEAGPRGGIAEDEVDYLNRAWHRLDPWPDAVEGLTRLKQKFIIATQSNGNIALMVNMAKRAGLPWDVILGSEVVGHYKPCPDAYINCADALGLPPAACMMTAAHNNDLVAASQQGFRTAFVCRPTEHGPDQTTDLKAEHDFDFVAGSFTELADRLGCP